LLKLNLLEQAATGLSDEMPKSGGRKAHPRRLAAEGCQFS
jgi:hypothetical protein